MAAEIIAGDPATQLNISLELPSSIWLRPSRQHDVVTATLGRSSLGYQP
ncbi:hypothetical protein CCACVL1_23919 [Corchorus capsularis]|uniref:Uncharacterized protein n=1 Tax=Corchorus capsularis TaxID=210143 RepID=A0A1R3GRQ3_COCAP|nr:hypothetical protein CCACVL1_23919 [Corchorus capsularis]